MLGNMKLPKMPEEWIEFFRKSGSKGGKRRRENLSPERRKEIARAGGKARWQKKEPAA